jgi:hypothetical protein
MAQRHIQPTTPDEMRLIYPIERSVEGWYFRAVEISNNGWLVEGSDLRGRKVSRAGTDVDALLAACVNDAQAIVASRRTTTE